MSQTSPASPLSLPWLRSCFAEEIPAPNTLDSPFVLICKENVRLNLKIGLLSAKIPSESRSGVLLSLVG